MNPTRNALKTRKIAWGNTSLEAVVRSFDNSLECDKFLDEEKHRVMHSGGAIFYHTDKPPLEDERIPGVSGVCYRYPYPPTQEIWCVQNCTFETLLNVVRFFDFPGNDCLVDAEVCLGAMRAFLLSLHQRKRLAILQIEDSHIMIELITPGDELKLDEVREALEINKQCFGLMETQREAAARMRHWIKSGFFTLGPV